MAGFRLVIPLSFVLLLAPAGYAQRSRGLDPEPVIIRAEQAIEAGRPWHATRILDSLLADSASRTPRAVLVAARAAAGWGGWSRVDRLLGPAPWRDSMGGEAHALLARSALARADHPAALRHARRAVETAVDAARPERVVLLARAHDRLAQRDSASAAWLSAADGLPTVAEWLRLRAAAATADDSARQAIFSRIQLPHLRTRIGPTDARALERAERWADAAARYLELGEPATALRLRYRAARSPEDRAAVRREVLAWFELPRANEDVRLLTDLLDREFGPLTVAEQLAVARRAAPSALLSRAASGFDAAATSGLLTDQDRFNYATTLARLGRHAEARSQFARVKGSQQGQAAYQSARTLMLMGRISDAIGALEQVARDHATDGAAAGIALYLRADLLSDRGDEPRARADLLRLVRDHPTSSFAPRAALRAALIAFRAGQPAAAAAELDLLRSTGGEEAAAATYWSARAWRAAGDSSAATVRFAAAASLRDEYYAMLAARELGRPERQVPAAERIEPASEGMRAALSRADLLGQLGLTAEAEAELEAMVSAAGGAALVSAAALLDSAGRADRSIRLAIRARARGAPEERGLYRLVFPLPWEQSLRDEAGRHGLDPLLIASLIRQESAFDPAARSRADARGLMQVLPSVGAEEARRTGLTGFDPALLFVPEVSLQLGTRHFADALRRFSALEHALAAYNAGASRVRRWLESPGVADDPAMFVERIPIVETRDYVRRILVNLSWYRAIYPN